LHEILIPINLRPGQVSYVRVNEPNLKSAVPVTSEFSECARNPVDGESDLRFVGFKNGSDDRSLQFSYINALGVSRNFTFELRHYKAFQGGNEREDSSGWAEGAYLLKPDDAHLDSYLYLENSNMSYTCQRGAHLKQYEFIYRSQDSSLENDGG